MRWASLLVALLCLVGCDRRVQQCNRLVDAINAEQPKVVKVLQPHEPTPEALLSFATSLDSLSRKIGHIALKDRALTGYRDRYAHIADGMASAARKIAANFEDRKEAAKAAGELNAFAKEERALEREINDYCGG